MRRILLSCFSSRCPSCILGSEGKACRVFSTACKLLGGGGLLMDRRDPAFGWVVCTGPIMIFCTVGEMAGPKAKNSPGERLVSACDFAGNSTAWWLRFLCT